MSYAHCGMVCVWPQIRVRIWIAASRCVSWRRVEGRCVAVALNIAARSSTRCVVLMVRRTSMSATYGVSRVQSVLTSSSTDAANVLTVTALQFVK